MNPSPALQIYPGDELKETRAMAALETGIFYQLRWLEWDENGFTLDVESLALVCKVSPEQFSAAWGRAISTRFVERGGRWFHERNDKERAKQTAWREKSKQGGRASAAARAKGGSTTVQPAYDGGSNGGSTNDQPPTQPTGNTSFSSSTSVTTTTPPKAPRAKRGAPDGAEGEVIAHYLSTHQGRRASDKQVAAVRRALGSGYSVADLCAAIDGNARDQWHVENRKHDLAYVLRDSGKIDDFRAKLEASRPRSAVDPVTGGLNSVGLALVAGGRS